MRIYLSQMTFTHGIIRLGVLYNYGILATLSYMSQYAHTSPLFLSDMKKRKKKK